MMMVHRKGLNSTNGDGGGWLFPKSTTISTIFRALSSESSASGHQMLDEPDEGGVIRALQGLDGPMAGGAAAGVQE